MLPVLLPVLNRAGCVTCWLDAPVYPPGWVLAQSVAHQKRWAACRHPAIQRVAPWAVGRCGLKSRCGCRYPSLPGPIRAVRPYPTGWLRVSRRVLLAKMLRLCGFSFGHSLVDLQLHPVTQLHAELLGFVYPPGFCAGWGGDDDAVRHLLPAM